MPKGGRQLLGTSGVAEEVGAKRRDDALSRARVELRREDQFSPGHDLRRSTTERGLEVETAVELGMKKKAGEFTSGGGEVYSSPHA